MANVYDIVMSNRKQLVDALIQNMEKGYIWTENAWNSAALRPYNPASECYYLGGNRARLMLAAIENSYDDPRWCTYNQAQANGWSVKRGAQSVLLEKWIFTETKIVENELGYPEKVTVELDTPKVNYFRVFNASQIHGIPKLEALPDPEYDSIIETATLSSKCPIEEKAVPRACYIPRKDIIEIPPRFSFKSAESYLSVQIHEMCHSTGHADRLNRSLLNTFGSPDYAREELRAELGATFFKANLNLPLSNEQLQDHSNYLVSWIKALKDDPNEFFRACKDAEKISDYLQKNYEEVLDRQVEHSKMLNQTTEHSYREKVQIIFEYETVNNIPQIDRMTRWYTEENTSVAKPYYGVNEVGISESMIEYRCTEILQEISPQDLRLQFEKQYSEAFSEKICYDIVSKVDDIKNFAADGMQSQDSSWGSWYGRIAHPDRPEDYIEINITEYNTRNTVIESANVVMGNNVKDKIVMREMSIADYLNFDSRDSTGFAQRIAEKILDFDPSIQSGYELYAPLGLSDHSLREHFALLEQRGYSKMPNSEFPIPEVESIYPYDKTDVVENIQDISPDKLRLFVDMDGTLTEFIPQASTAPLYQQGYFAELPPHEKVIAAIKEIIENHPEIEVNILSAYLTDSKYALEEKNQWLDKYLPEVDKEHRIFVPNGSNKKEFIGQLTKNDFLLDDYTPNLTKWLPGRSIKLLNAINHTRGTWQYDRIRFDREPADLAKGIADIVKNHEHIYDKSVHESVKKYFTVNINSDSIPTFYNSLDEALKEYFQGEKSQNVFGPDSRTLGAFMEDKSYIPFLERQYGVDIVNPEHIETAALKSDIDLVKKTLQEFRDPSETYMDRINRQFLLREFPMTESLEKNLMALHEITGQEYYLNDLAKVPRYGITHEVDFGSGQEIANEIYSECRDIEMRMAQELMADAELEV